MYKLIHRYEGATQILKEIENDALKNEFQSFYDKCRSLTSSRMNSVDQHHRRRSRKQREKLCGQKSDESVPEETETDDISLQTEADLIENRFHLLSIQ